MQNCQRAFSGCANGSRLYPTKNDPVAHASGSSNPDLNVTPFDTLRRTLTERHYRIRGPLSFLRSHAVTSALKRDAIDEILDTPINHLPDQPVDIRMEAREAFVELTRKTQIIDDCLVEPLARNQQRNTRRIRRQQDAGHTPFEFINRHAINLPMHQLCIRF